MTHPSTKSRDTLVRTSTRVVWLATLASVGFGLAILAGLVASAAAGERFTAFLLGAEAGADLAARTNGLRWLLVLGAAMAVLIYALLRALGRILATVPAGEPFVPDNAARLRTIGACMLGLQLLDAPAALIAHAYPALGAAAPHADVSPAGWLAVLMAFVLARIFEAGTRLRDDLEGTV